MTAKKLKNAEVIETPEAKAEVALEQVTTQVVPMLNEWTHVLKLKNDEEQATADESLTTIKLAMNRLEEDRKSFVEPLNTVVKRINARYKPIREQLELAEKHIKHLIVGRLNELRAVEQAKAEKEAKKAEKQGADELAQDIREAALSKPVGVVMEGVSTRKNYSCKVNDEAKVPREYMVPDEKKLNAIARALKEDFKIPGCVLVVEETLNKSV